jgi:hypothetical protein
MGIPTLFYVLVFMGSVSADPNVSLVQQFTAFHFANDDSGYRLCNQWRKDFNELLVRRNATSLGRFECHVMTVEELLAPRKPMY